MSLADFAVVAAAPDHAAALTALFARADVACHCRYWHFQGNTNAWLERCAHAPEANRVEMTAALAERSAEMMGVVAIDFENDVVVGWLKLVPAAAVPKIYEQRVYRKLPCFAGPRDGIFTVGCFLVDPARRKHGVARALLDGAVALARSQGATAIEAFPRRAEGTRDEEVWTGPVSLFRAAGFDIVDDFAPYPVLRLSI